MIPDAAFPVALEPLPASSGGGLLYAERLSGNVMLVSGTDPPTADVTARVTVSTDGEQRGLLGVAVSPSGQTYAAWTDERGRLVVGRARRSGPPDIVWEGPHSADRANGGHIAFAPNGSLVIGVGDLLDGAAAADPSTPNGKLLALEPDGPVDQTPRVISSGWNNPFAFDFAPDGTLYVADNVGGPGRERLAIGNAGPEPVVIGTFAPHSVPSALAVIDDDHLAVCTYLTRRLTVWSRQADGGAARWTPSLPIAVDCATGVAALADGTIVYANETQILALDP